MKNLLYILAAAIIMASCSSSKETAMTKQDKKTLKKLAEQEVVKQAVESRRYIIKMNKLYPSNGSNVDLVPTNNYFIINGEIASVCLLYVGRSMSSRPITGINFNGHTVTYQMNNDESKGMYNINMKVQKGADSFDFYLTIGSTGSCTLSVVNAYIQSATYMGEILPIPDDGEITKDNSKRI